jgi:transposase
VDAVYWSDEMRMGLLGVWASRGVKVVQKVEFEGKWLYLNLAVNGKSGRLRWGWSENMKSETIAGVLEGWGKEGVKVVVWDRALGHDGKAYQGVHVQRIEHPPYSSELNLTERVFEICERR